MKAFGLFGQVDAGAYVVMHERSHETRTGSVAVRPIPVGSFARYQDAADAVLRKLQFDAENIAFGENPGDHHYYIIPVEHTP